MLRYETLFLTVPEITKDEMVSLEKQLDDVIRAVGGTMISFERWGKYRLAYPVARNDYGIYFLVRFEVDREPAHRLLDDIHSLFTLKYNNLVTRNMTSVLDSRASLHYQRPESLEETPHDVDDFLRKNKMEGLINKSSTKREVARPSQEGRTTQEAVVVEEVDQKETE